MPGVVHQFILSVSIRRYFSDRPLMGYDYVDFADIDWVSMM
ncbi:hypothetical protein SAMN05421821_101642 [Mucilaginibacter lappiensis]|uniref:Uncharacterized protein n=1 Tax=Mucilaginibacter lappiensis TaxID=354630 RepID=A0ABR6PCK2_9SPHI|nr:hypothetical protein [Mucilaginibacter lappiensis]SIQ08722.1 hypothetical protein SAMN05421821_101642 [Mucilaginibacter lappiensis]